MVIETLVNFVKIFIFDMDQFSEAVLVVTLALCNLGGMETSLALSMGDEPDM